MPIPTLVGVSGAGTEPTDEITSADVYDLLANKRRRYAIHYLKQVDGPVSARELAEQVAAWENDKPIDRLDSQERKRVYISLYQSHLSTLDEAGLVHYDEDTKEVELTDATADADVYIELVPSGDIPWSYFYLGLSVAAAALLALVWAEVGVLRDAPMLPVAAAIVALYGVTAVAHTISRGRAKLGDEGPPPELRGN